MSIFSVNKGAKSQALQYEALATNLQGQQRDIDFARNLLSNIRQERLARAQTEAYGYSDDTVSSSQQGALANIESALAGEMGYSYKSSERMEKIQNYQLAAQEQWKKYQKSIQKAGMAGQIVGTVATVAGSIIGGPLGAAVGAAVGTGLTSAMGGGHVATGASLRSGITGTITAGIAQGAGYLAEAGKATEGGLTAYKTASGATVLGGAGAATKSALSVKDAFLTTKSYLSAADYFKVAQSAYSAGGYGNVKGMW